MELQRDRSVNGQRLCPACRNLIPEQAERCIHCGFDLRKGTLRRKRVLEIRNPSMILPRLAEFAKRLLVLAILAGLGGWATRRPIEIGPLIRHEIGTERCKDCGGKGTTTCPECGGFGRITVWEPCAECNGSGNFNWRHPKRPWARCADCHGKGKVEVRTPCPRCKGTPTGKCTACDGTGRRPLHTPSAAMGLSPWEWFLQVLNRPIDPNPRPQRSLRGSYPLVEQYCALPSHPSKASILEWGEFMPDGDAWRMEALVRLESKSGAVTNRMLAFWVQDRVLTRCSRQP